MTDLKLCFWGYAEGSPSINIKMHSHDFYQLNFSLSGECELVTETKRFHIRKNDIFLVAPNVPHTLEYKQKYLSHAYKFYYEGMPVFDPVLHVQGNPTTERMIRAADIILKSTFPLRFFDVLEGTVVMPGDRYQVLMEHYLSGVIAALFQEPEHHMGVIAKIYDILEHSPSHIFSVKEAAETCGYTRSHFSAMIRRQTGQTARDFLNGIKLKIARNYLRYSDKSIAEIAELIGFSSQFHFSVFFKRNTGISPLRFRKERNKL